MSNYSLDIISHHPKFNGKNLRKYHVEGIDTVGVWGDEPFEIRFKNNTYQKVQIKLSLDGTDILSGQPADTSISNKMWVVNGYETLSLKAWPETNNGGASFVFTSVDNSVAAHTHGNLSSRGIIAAAVFVEGYVEPIQLTINNPPPIVIEKHYYPNYPYWYQVYPTWTVPDITCNTGGTFGSNVYPCVSSNEVYNQSYFSDISEKADLVAIGAGDYVEQNITQVAGLIKPLLSETIRIKYLWWDDLQEKLRVQNSAQPQPSGFPADSKGKNIDLKNTPRIKSESFYRVATQ